MNKTSRRQFLKVTGAAAGAAIAAPNLRAWVPTSRPVSLAVVPQLSVFNYSQVELLDGLFRLQFENNHRLYLSLNEDALLKPFRHRAGMPAPGPDMGGWYDDANDFSTPDNFMPSSPDTASVNMYPGWRVPMQSPATSRPRKKCIGSSVALPRL